MGNTVTRKGSKGNNKDGRGTPARRDSRLTRSRKNAMTFLKETWVELRWKTSWPQKPDLLRFTLVVIVAVIIVAIYIGLADVIVAALTRPFYNR
jgi:preprotein translocase subunit SecE